VLWGKSWTPHLALLQGDKQGRAEVATSALCECESVERRGGGLCAEVLVLDGVGRSAHYYR
jgi:hypothetical protein